MKIIDSKLFDINRVRDVDIHSIKVGNSKWPLIYIDNFYKNPDDIRKLSEELPYFKDKYVLGNSPGVRCGIKINAMKIKDILYDLFDIFADNFMKENDINDKHKPSVMMFTRTRSNEKGVKFKQTGAPHVDYVPDSLKPTDHFWNFATVCYLNKGDECKGGTAFYRHKESGLEVIRTDEESHSTRNWHGIDPLNEDFDWLSDSTDLYENIYTVKMKFNRMVVYPANVLHSGYVKSDYFTDKDRIIKSIFL